MTNPTTGSQPRRAPGRRWLWGFAVAGIYLLPFVTLDGALSIYLKLGDIEGESKDQDHKDEIEVLSWGWGASREGIDHTVGQRDRGQTTVNDLAVSKRIDTATTEILLHCFNGKHIDEATLTVSEGGSKGPLDILEIELKQVLLSSYDVSGGDGTEEPVENVTLSYDQIQTTYTLFKHDDEPDGTSEFYWSVSTNTGGGSSSDGGGTGPPPNLAPTISDISSPTPSIDEDGSMVVSFTISDPETPAGSLILGRSSSNQALLPLSNIVFGGSGGNRTATLTPAPDQYGTSSVVITVSDGSRTDSSSTILTVNPVNDPPGLELLGNHVTEADVPLEVSVTVVDGDSNIDDVGLTGTASPGALVASIDDITGTGNIRTLRIVPAPGATGTSTITMTANDHAVPTAGITQTSFSLTINPATGTGPTAVVLNGLESGTPVAVDENTPDGTDLGLFDAIDGPGIEHEFILLDSAGGRFSIGGPDNLHLLVANGSLLDFEDISTHTIVVQARDLSDPLRTRTDSFLIELQNVNEAPAITLPPDFGTTPPDTDFSLDDIVINDPDSGPADIVVTFAVGDGILTIDDSGPLAGKTVGNATNSVVVTAPVADFHSVLAAPNGLIYRSDEAFTGTETLTINTDDGGNSGSGGVQGDQAGATLEVDLTPWEIWRRANFTAAELLDPNVSSFTADPDRDGLGNGGEYGVGGAPKDSTDGPNRIQLVYVETGGESYPALLFPRRSSDPDFSIEFEVATNLLNWVSGPAYTLEEPTIPIDADFNQATIRTLFPVSLNPKEQLRLRFAIETP